LRDFSGDKIRGDFYGMFVKKLSEGFFVYGWINRRRKMGKAGVLAKSRSNRPLKRAKPV
jgi:hypothetical protein